MFYGLIISINYVSVLYKVYWATKNHSKYFVLGLGAQKRVAHHGYLLISCPGLYLYIYTLYIFINITNIDV